MESSILENESQDFAGWFLFNSLDKLPHNGIGQFLQFKGHDSPVWKIWEEFETFLENKQISKMRKKTSWRPNCN